MKLHTKKILAYKRLLEKAQASSAAQLHALGVQVRILKENAPSANSAHIHANGIAGADVGICVCGGKKRKGYWAGYRDDNDFSDDEDGDDEDKLVKALKGRGGTFDERAVRKALRGLSREERMRL